MAHYVPVAAETALQLGISPVVVIQQINPHAPLPGCPSWTTPFRLACGLVIFFVMLLVLDIALWAGGWLGFSGGLGFFLVDLLLVVVGLAIVWKLHKGKNMKDLFMYRRK